MSLTQGLRQGAPLDLKDTNLHGYKVVQVLSKIA